MISKLQHQIPPWLHIIQSLLREHSRPWLHAAHGHPPTDPHTHDVLFLGFTPHALHAMYKSCPHFCQSGPE